MRVLVQLAALAGVLGCALAAAHGFEVDIGPEAVVMEAKYNKPALFPHRRHQEWYGCIACHHFKDRTMTIGTCASCHDETMVNDELNSLRKAAHELCKGCHSREREKGRAAPSSCRVCHPPDLAKP